MGLMDDLRTDREALRRALEVARGEDEGRRRQIDSMLADGRDWTETAKFAAYCAQGAVLGLLPWQSPPCCSSLVDLDKPFGDTRGARESAELLKKLLALGLSKYEPNPLQAITAAEARHQPCSR
jgi:hypothetical protein